MPDRGRPGGRGPRPRQLDELHEKYRSFGEDQVVSYYPPEAEADRHLFGLAGTDVDGTQWRSGDCSVRFPLHSVSKVFTYGLALEDNGAEETLRRVGVEPSVRGVGLCRELSATFGLHVFADPVDSRFGRVAQPAPRA